MSPQSRANNSGNTTFEASDGGGGVSNNPCSSPVSVAELAWAADVAFKLHKIESSASNSKSPVEPPLLPSVREAATSLRKRSSLHLSSTPKDPPQPFLASYGSAFLSGIFADIAEASSEHNDESNNFEHAGPASIAESADQIESYLPCKKKSRTTLNVTAYGGHTKSYKALAELAEGAASTVSSASPTVVSPRSNTSTLKIQLFNDQVRELQNLAFPSLPCIPITVSSSLCSTTDIVGQVVTPRDNLNDSSDEQEQESSSAYGWFVSTDEDGDRCAKMGSSHALYASVSDPDLAFKAITAPNAENHDIEVQQALAADTIDDVLGDFF